MNACDARALYTRGDAARTVVPFWGLPNSTYAWDWVNMGGAYDFMRSTAPHKPLLDTEWHTISTVAFRDGALPAQYVVANWWVAALRGLSRADVWFWGRQGWTPNTTISHEFGGADVAYSLLTQPRATDGFVHGHAQVMALAEHFALLASQPREVRPAQLLLRHRVTL